MKKNLYIFAILPFFSFAIFAQNFGSDPADGGMVKKPVIDNINADAVITTGADDHQIKFNKVDGNNGGNTGTNGTSTQGTVMAKQGFDIGAVKDSEDPIIEEIKRDLKIYPIPAVNNLNIDLGRIIGVEISLLNIIGQEMYSFAGQTRDLSITVSELPQGTYFLSIKIGKDLIVKRVEVTE